MASDYSQWLGNKIIRWLGGNAMPTAPTSLEIGLFDGDPKSGGTEVTTDIIAGGRQTVSFDVPASGTDNAMLNDAIVDFGESENDVDVSHFAVYTDGGDFIASDTVPGGPFAVTTGTPVTFEVGDLELKLGSP